LILPTPFAVGLAIAGAPLAVLLATLAPVFWPLGLLWVVVLGALIIADATLGANRRALVCDLHAPSQVDVGAAIDVRVELTWTRGQAPGSAAVGFETNSLLKPRAWTWRSRAAGNLIAVDAVVDALRRGEAVITRAWIEWRCPLGLVAKRRSMPMDRKISIVPATRAVREEAMKIFARETQIGAREYVQKGGGSEFESLREFLAGMDRRTIDWKQSARHMKLLAKEFRTERDQTVIIALDTGRLMCEPVAGLPKIDHAISAAMLLSYVGLKMGDRIGLFGFDARPRVAAAPMAGVGAFPLLQRLAAQLDYSTEETNFSLGLSELSATTQRRSLVVIFTDFADPTSAELMIENVGRLVRKHLVLFIAIRDQELEDITAAQPQSVLDATRSVIAHSLLQERELVLSRLQRLGVELIDAPLDMLGPKLLNRYLEVKHASRL
jgi:uncharacterized protein (DUF58 family)